MTGRQNGSRRKPLTNEMLRILQFVSDGKVNRNDAYRWVIDGPHARPDRRSRELLVKRGYIVEMGARGLTGGSTHYVLTDLGRAALEEIGPHYVR